MRADLITSISGYVKVEIRGRQLETLLNQLTVNQMKLWGVRRTSHQTIQFYIPLTHFFKLKPFLKQTGCRVHVLERYGFPFLLEKLGRRKFFAAGLILFVLGMYLLSSVVWNVEVVGNERISTSDIIERAKEHGIYPLQWKFHVQDLDKLSNQLMKDLPDASWIGIELQGTRIEIQVVESSRPEIKPLISPRHIVSTSDAVISKIIAEQGQPVVKINSRVKQGDILISGKIGDDEHFDIVPAKGEVKGLVWYEYNLEIPLIRKYKVYTGDVLERFHIVLGSRALQLTGYGQEGYHKFETESTQSQLQWRQFKLPIGWLKETIRAVNFQEVPITREAARASGLEMARADLLQKLGADIEIKDEKILHEKADSGKVYIKALYEVEQDITTERVITPAELKQYQENNTEQN